MFPAVLPGTCSICASIVHTAPHAELDMVILGQLQAFSNTSSAVSVQARHRETERQKFYTSFSHQGMPVCSKMFRFLHGIGETRLKSLSRHLRQSGLTPRTHGNVKRKPAHALSFLSIKYIVTFIHNYAEQHALLLPRRVPGYSRSDIQLLPSSVSKRAIWRVYHTAAEADGTVHPAAYTTFCYIWRKLVPSIVVMKPRSNLCWQCQQNSTAIVRTANRSEAEKSTAIASALQHLKVVKSAREHYKTTCQKCKESVHAHFVSNGQFSPPSPGTCAPCNSVDIEVHYSFDYAQQVHYPSDPLQPGPIYFLTPRKCTVFGVCCGAVPRQVTFLTDEAGECGKGANAVVSRIHYFFANHGLGEMNVHLHADNCVGQNKNNCMVQYLVWRTLTGRHTNVTLSFLPVGHTKFSPDWCFGLFKRAFRRTKVSSMEGITEVVMNSAQCNEAQLVSREDGSIIVPSYDWTGFLAPHMNKIVGIKNFHHFRMSSSSPCLSQRVR